MSRQTMHLYELYGRVIQSQVALPSVPKGSGKPAINITLGPDEAISRASQATLSSDRDDWFAYGELGDGTLYLRWRRLFEFVVAPDGSRIACRSTESSSSESLETYLVSQVLSCALLRMGIEPIHATVVSTPRGTVGF